MTHVCKYTCGGFIVVQYCTQSGALQGKTDVNIIKKSEISRGFVG